MAYTGNPVFLEDLLFTPEHNLIDQSMSARGSQSPTNADGFGVGWYGKREQPGMFRSIRPAWNDANLRDLAAQIESPHFLAHVRASSSGSVQESNCHPFRHGRWLFVHNGEIASFPKLRRALALMVNPELFCEIQGTTDSELMFHLALTFGLETDPPGALARMAGAIEQTARDRGVSASLWMTVAATDGVTLYAVRYASDGRSPTLFHSRDAKDVGRLNPDLEERFGLSARAIVSEPIGSYEQVWVTVPPDTLLRVHAGAIEMAPFRPEA
jgi:glutamine amidotransferase